MLPWKWNNESSLTAAQQMILWQIYVVNNNNTYFSLHVKCFCPILTKFGFSRQISIQDPNTNFPKILPVHAKLTVADRETGRHDEATEKRTNMAKPIGTFHKHANMHQNNAFLLIACRGVKQFHGLTVLRGVECVRSVKNTNQRWWILVIQKATWM